MTDKTLPQNRLRPVRRSRPHPTSRPRNARPGPPAARLEGIAEQREALAAIREIVIDCGPPVTPQQFRMFEGLDRALDGPIAYWDRVAADMDAAEVELKLILGGKS